MNEQPTMNDRIARWLVDEAEGELPDWVLDQTFARTQTTAQVAAARAGTFERLSVRRLPAWLGAAAAIVVAIAALLALGSTFGPGGPTPSPSASPRPSAGQSPGASITGWEAFTSSRLGISVEFPDGWTIVPATAPWIWQPADPGPSSEATDRALGPSNEGFVVSSQRLPDSMTEDEWWSDYLGAATTGMPAGCFPSTRDAYEAISVDGAAAFVHGGIVGCNFTEAVAIVGGRAYQLTAYPNVMFPSGAVFDRATFDRWLASVAFDPASADDSPTASGPPGPTP